MSTSFPFSARAWTLVPDQTTVPLASLPRGCRVNVATSQRGIAFAYQTFKTDTILDAPIELRGCLRVSVSYCLPKGGNWRLLALSQSEALVISFIPGPKVAAAPPAPQVASKVRRR